ncbi:translation elongation factor Ts [candidate division KSB1 bacterium]|nr:translation elongation factor Ts [candidate division KSB1 bacterium]
MSISAADVKNLREKTGAGMMDCKRALQETNGDMDKAIDYLRKKGIEKVEKKAGRQTKEGIVQAYIHPGSRLGVLLEVNCETDFVARNDEFQSFVKDLAMQIAAAKPLVVKREDLPQEVVDKEKEIYLGQVKEQGKPDHIAEKIVAGKLEKYFQEACLMEQSFVKDPNKTIQELLTEKITTIGENIVIKRFVRYELGE